MIQNCWFVIPAFNEGRAIAATLAAFKGSPFNLIVVDDCSVDDTSTIAEGSGAWVCRHAVNLGQGAALQTGIEFALRKGAETIVTFDSDGQHRIEDAVGMMERLQREQLDIVLGSRFLGETLGMPRAKRLLLRAATFYTRLQTGLRLTDTHNGLRAMSASAARKIELRQNRMAHASEILGQIAHSHLAWAEHPVTIVYTDYSKAKGQRLSGMFDILLDLHIGRFHR